MVALTMSSASSTSALDTPTSTSDTTANTTPPSRGPLSKVYRDRDLSLSCEDIEFTFSITSGDFTELSHQRDQFAIFLSLKKATDDLLPLSAVSLALQFIQFLLDSHIPQKAIQPLLPAFERQFLSLTDIHTLVSLLPDSLQTRKQTLKTYYAAAAACFFTPKAGDSALFKASESGSVRLCAVFGGQGATNPICVSELRDLTFQYGSLLTDLINTISPMLENLARLPETENFYHSRHLKLDLWLRDPQSAPDQNTLAGAAFSLPIVGLTSFAHFCVTCKVLNKTPGEMRSQLHGVTGHSQGLAVAAAIARSDSWSSFYENARLAIEMLFWTGYECQQAAPRCSLPAKAIADSVLHGEGEPASLLSVRGLARAQLEAVIATCNKSLAATDGAYLALANSRDNFVVAGPTKALCGVNLQLRGIKAADDLDQSRIPYSRRKPVVHHQFLPVNAPFHTPYLEKAAEKVKKRLSGKSFRSCDITIPVYHTKTGLDIRQDKDGDLVKILVNAITADFVDWPAAMRFPDASHIIAFDGGRIGDLIAKNKEGEGVRVVMATEMETFVKDAGTQGEIFAPHLLESSLRTLSWGDRFRPRLVESNSGEPMLDTKLSRLLGTPPVMVAGMTPTTVPWDVVSAIMNAGYHVELAGGGYMNAETMSTAIKKIVESVPPGRGVTCNLIYVSPQAMAWQIPMLGQLIRNGIPIDGLTIGAGVPSPEVVAEYITTLGLKHISFKPGSLSAIRQVISVAKVFPSFPVILQWTGGRGGGHHSFEDFHAPILSTYSEIRKCSNLILVAGSGFGGADETYPYFTGTWAHEFGRCLMPFDGILLGSRMMVAKEAHTSSQAKRLIIEANGASNWEQSYDREVGGVITVQSEMGQPIHKIANRGVRFWREMDDKIFKLPKAKRVAELEKHKDWIIRKLNADYSKPWFGQDTSGKPIEVFEMTYAEVLTRLVDLMYVNQQSRWIDESYSRLVLDFAYRTAERMPEAPDMTASMLKDPHQFLKTFLGACPDAHTEQLHPEDVSFFFSRCRARHQKPVNFVPALDENFESYFKKDSLWQSEDADAVVDQDAGRVCILHGPVSAQYSLDDNETVKTILDGICKAHATMVRRDYYMESEGIEKRTDSGKWFSDPGHTETAVMARTQFSETVIDQTSVEERLSNAWSSCPSDWIDAILSEEFVLQGYTRVLNPFRRLFQLQCRVSVQAENGKLDIQLTKESDGQQQILAWISSSKDSEISVDLYQPSHHGLEPVTLPFKFRYDFRTHPHSLSEVMGHRNDRIKSFYSRLWLGQDLDLSKRADSTFAGEEITLSWAMLQDMVSTVGRAYGSDEMTKSACDVFPIDVCIVVAWDVLVRPLLVKDIDGDLLRLVHRSNTFEYVSEHTPLRVGERVSAKSRVRAIIIEPAGKSIVVKAEIERSGQVVATVTSTFFYRGSFSDFASTFQHSDEPESKLDVTTLQDQGVLRDREWFLLDDPELSLVGKCLIFRLVTHVTWRSNRAISRLETTGIIYERPLHGRLQKIGQVYFVAHDCQGNPVMDFLAREGTPTTNTTDLKTPGWFGNTSLDVTIPSTNDNYARISRDYNPIHVSPIFADWASLPGTITHGMFTSAITRGALEHLTGDDERLRFRRLSTSFVGMVLPRDKLTISFQHTAMVEGRMVLKVVVYKKDTEEKVLEGEAEIEQATTAYAFTGQGSQEQGMGMALYKSSEVARRIWDEADETLQDLYGKFYILPSHCFLELMEQGGQF